MIAPKSPSLECSEAIIYSYNVYKENFLRIVPIDEILDDLKVKGILSDKRTKMIKECSARRQRNEELFEILVNERSDEDFDQFIEILESDTVGIVRKLAEKLKRKATEFITRTDNDNI